MSMDTTIMRTPISQAIVLPSGRRLGIAEQGDPGGAPVLFFHGFVGSRLQCPPDGTITAAMGVRLIAVDRPGIGLSDRLVGRYLLDWAQDIKMLAELLHLPRFAILGWSAGAPHALACASLLPEQVVALGLASPMGGWFIRPGATRHISKAARGITALIRYAPWALKPAFKLLQWRIEHNPQQLAEKQIRQLPAIDQASLADPLIRQMFIETIAEPFRHGVGGVYDDTLCVAHPWGFTAETIEVPVWIWHGEADSDILPALAKELADKLQHCQISMLAGEGHFLLFTHWQNMLQTLARASQKLGSPLCTD